MRVENVDIVEMHALQALFEAGNEHFARRTLSVRTFPHVITGLGGDYHLVAMALEVVAVHLAESLLGAAEWRPVIVCQIEASDAVVECIGHLGERLFVDIYSAEIPPKTK